MLVIQFSFIHELSLMEGASHSYFCSPTPMDKQEHQIVAFRRQICSRVAKQNHGPWSNVSKLRPGGSGLSTRNTAGSQSLTPILYAFAGTVSA